MTVDAIRSAQVACIAGGTGLAATALAAAAVPSARLHADPLPGAPRPL